MKSSKVKSSKVKSSKVQSIDVLCKKFSPVKCSPGRYSPVGFSHDKNIPKKYSTLKRSLLKSGPFKCKSSKFSLGTYKPIQFSFDI